MKLNRSKVLFLLQSDAIPGSTVFEDKSDNNHLIYRFGNTQHVSDQDDFGATAIRFDGSGDYLKIIPGNLLVLDSDFTISFRAKPTLNDLGDIFSARYFATNGLTYRFYQNKQQVFYGNGLGIKSAEISYVYNIYEHYAIVRNNGIVSFYQGGVEVGVIDWDGITLNTDITSLFFGSNGYDTSSYLYADIKELVIANYAVWTEDFTPPTEPYELISSIALESTQIISSIIQHQHTQLISIAPRLYHQVTQILATARRVNLIQNQLSDTTTQLYLSQDQVFNNLAQVALLTTQVMRNYGASVALEMLQTWAAYDYNLVYLPMVQLLGAQLEGVLTEIQFSVTVAASPVGIVECDFDRKGFCNVATLLLRDRSEWANKQIGDPVALTVLGEQYQLIVINKPQDEQIGQGSYEVGYLLECASITCQLAEGLNPDIAASRVTASFPAGTMLTEILDFLTGGVCDYALAVPDFPTGGYDFEDAERFAALREVLPADPHGWVIETDQAGVLQLSQWTKPQIGGAGQKTLTCSRKSLTPPTDTLYTAVEVRNYNQQDGTSGLRLEVVDNGDGTGTIYGYSVPWTDAFSIFDSEDSPSPSLLIIGGDVEEVEVEDTEVEFSDYAATLSKQCYSDPVIDWGNNDSLSPVTYTESGALTTATEPGYSVAVKVSYTTRRKVWTYGNRKPDVSQVRLKYNNGSNNR